MNTKKKTGGMGQGSKIKGTGTLTNTDSKGNVIGATGAIQQSKILKKKKGGPYKKKKKTGTVGAPKMYRSGGFIEPPIENID